jgi:hypothetical protein
MTTDDSPALGGQNTDNAPMISSVQTRVIADARGAYITGNLDALVQHMSVDQRHQFRRALVEMAVFYLEPNPDWDQPYREPVMEAARAFLSAQTPEAIQEALAAARNVHRISGLEPFYDQEYVLDDWSLVIAHLLQSFLPSPVRELESAAAEAAGLGGDEASYYALKSIFRQRITDAAWALLQGREVSLARPVAQTELDSVLSDRNRMLNEGNWAALIRLMNDEQRMRFRQHIVRQSITLVEALPPDSTPRTIAMLDAVRRWLDDSSADNASAVAAFAASIRGGLDRSPRAMQPSNEAMEATWNAIVTVLNPNLVRAAQTALIAVEYRSLHRDAKPELWRLAEQWRKDTAWAILQGHEPPPIRI